MLATLMVYVHVPMLFSESAASSASSAMMSFTRDDATRQVGEEITRTSQIICDWWEREYLSLSCAPPAHGIPSFGKV